MALYEYLCEDCSKTFTVQESIAKHEKGRRKRACPECGGRKTHQLFSSFFAKTSSKS
ncbi:MAG: FmdB family zinc ribbon protein [Gemmatimonadota bacterium]